MALAAVLALPGMALAGHGTETVNATVRVFPFVLTLGVEQAEVAVGEQFALTASIRNLSANNLRQTVAVVTFESPDGALAELRGPLDKHYGAVTPRRDKSVEWKFTALAPGTFQMSVVVEALDPDAEGTVANEQVITVVISGAATSADQDEESDEPRGRPPLPPGIPDLPTPQVVFSSDRRGGTLTLTRRLSSFRVTPPARGSE